MLVQKGKIIEVVLSVKGEKFFLEIIDKVDGKRETTNDQEKILKTIKGIKYKTTTVVDFVKDKKFYYDCGYDCGLRLTLKDCDIYNTLDLYSHVLNNISEETTIVKNVKNNNAKILRLAFITLALCGSITALVSLSKKGSLLTNETSSELLKEGLTQDLTPTLTLTPTPTPTSIPTPTPTLTPTPTSIPTPTPTLTPTPTSNPQTEFEIRLNEALVLCSNDKLNNSEFPLATKFNENSLKKVQDFCLSDTWQYYIKYGSDFGVDPYLLLAISYAETNLEHEKTLPNGSSYNGFAVGIFQHETPDEERTIVAYNYNEGVYEYERMCMESACNIELNIKMAAMILQNNLHKYNNNIYLVIQSYNYGDGAMEIILNCYAKEIGCEVSEVINNIHDTGWLKYVDDFHFNPNKYISWEQKTYGDNNYIKNVLGYYIGSLSENLNRDGSRIVFNFIGSTTIKYKAH